MTIEVVTIGIACNLCNRAWTDENVLPVLDHDVKSILYKIENDPVWLTIEEKHYCGLCKRKILNKIEKLKSKGNISV